MKEVLTIISENLIGYDETTNYYFDAIYESSDYSIMGWFILLFPLLVLFFYYRIVDPVLSKVWHWLIAALISLVLVCCSSFFLLYNGSLKWDVLNYIPEESESLMNPTFFIFEVSLVMVLASLLPLLILTFFLRFISTNNKRNPF